MRPWLTNRWKIGSALVCCLWLWGCAATPTVGDAKTQTTFNAPASEVKKAAVDALVVTGFDVKKETPDYVEGYRPRKVGLVVGSGGETVGIWLKPDGDRTLVQIDTARTFAGGAGQKEWGDTILAEMNKSLSQ